MSSSSKSTCINKFKNRLVKFISLFFIVFTSYSRESSSLQPFKHYLSVDHSSPSDFLDSSQVSLNTNYAPIYSETDKTSSSVSQHVVINASNVCLKYISRYEHLRYYLICSRDKFDVSYRKENDGYLIVNKRNEWNLLSGIAYQNNNLFFGLGIGRHCPVDMKREHFQDVRDHISKYLTAGPWQVSFDAKYNFYNVVAHLSLFSGPVHSSITRLFTSDEKSYRSFPISLIQHSADIGFDLSIGSLFSGSFFGIGLIENSDLQKIPNGMPTDLSISSYRLKNHGCVKLPFTDSLGWNLSGTIAGGWLASYNFDRNRFTFLKSDEVRFYNFDAGVGIRVSSKLTTGASQSVIKYQSPSGFLRLSAFSAWSIFESRDYRYSNIDGMYSETGSFITYNFSGRHFEFRPQLYVSHIFTRMSLSSSHKEIVVLMPVYVDDGQMDVLKSRLLLVEPSCVLNLKFGRISICGALNQDIPVNMSHKETAGKPSVQQRNENKRIIGGTRMSITVICKIPDHLKSSSSSKLM